LTLEQLKIFVEAARFASFAVAAERLGLTASAVSISVKKLEERHGVTLFDRSTRRLMVTEAGHVLLTEAERILRDVELTVRRIESWRDGADHYPIVACTQSAYDHWLPGVIARMGGKEMPRIDMLRGSSEDIASWVMRGSVDIGITEVEPSHPQFRHLGIFQDRIILCATPDRAAMLPADPGWVDMTACGPIVWEHSDVTSSIVAAFEHHKVELRRVVHPYLRLTSSGAVVSLALSGRFPALVSLEAARFALATGKLRRVGTIEIPLKYWMYSLREREIEPLASLIAKAVGQKTRDGA
jgi:DNA-binding transcriptional LysR family regulator